LGSLDLLILFLLVLDGLLVGELLPLQVFLFLASLQLLLALQLLALLAGFESLLALELLLPLLRQLLFQLFALQCDIGFARCRRRWRRGRYGFWRFRRGRGRFLPRRRLLGHAGPELGFGRRVLGFAVPVDTPGQRQHQQHVRQDRKYQRAPAARLLRRRKFEAVDDGGVHVEGRNS